MVNVEFNGSPQAVDSVEDLGNALNRFDAVSTFELWLSVANGPSMCMLRQRQDAWLMYLEGPGDRGVRTVGSSAAEGLATFVLGNGQVDEYPRAWCISLGECYKAVTFFFVNKGARPDWLKWHTC